MLDVAAMQAYREDYFRRLRGRATWLAGIAPLALLFLGSLDAYLTQTFHLGSPRTLIWLVASCVLVGLVVAMRRVTTLEAHGWFTVALLALTTLALTQMATPTLEGAMWALPAIIIVPIVAAPFWIWMRKNVIACVACYGLGTLLFARVDMPGQWLVAYACLASMCTLICIVMFLAMDGTRRLAYEHQRTLAHHAHHDALTGLPSRRRFLELSAQALARARADGGHVSLSFIDLDHFKRVNDTHGHAAGDRALEEFAQLLTLQMRPGMVAGRLGGEEFVLLQPGMRGTEAAEFVEALRRETAGLDMGGFRVSMSAGVVELGAEEEFSSALQRADEALMAAKAAGRNRVLPG